MSYTPTLYDGSTGPTRADESVQREWDHFAMGDQIAVPEFSDDLESCGSPLAPASLRSTNETTATGAFDALSAKDATTALGDAYAGTGSADLADEDIGDHDDRGAFRCATLLTRNDSEPSVTSHFRSHGGERNENLFLHHLRGLSSFITTRKEGASWPER